MKENPQRDSKTISLEQTDLKAVKCEECGAKIYLQTLLDDHLIRHRLRKRRFSAEIRKLQFTFSHMRDFA